MSNFRNRIKELRHVPASELRANPKNWRTHPPSQRSALQAVLAEVGIVDAVLARETENGLELIDGHLRTDISGSQPIPVLVVDLDEAEANIVLATFDPLTEMAKADRGLLASLLEGINAPGLADVLGDIAKQNDLGALVSPEGVAESMQDIQVTYQVLVTCRDEQAQLELLEKMEAEGFECRALIS